MHNLFARPEDPDPRGCVRLPKADRGDGPCIHELAGAVTFSVPATLGSIASAAAHRLHRLRGRKDGITSRSTRLVVSKTHEGAERIAVIMRLCASAMESSRFVLRCLVAASLAYGLASLVGLQHPVWAPIEALIVSQESIGETFDTIQGRLGGTLIGVVVALFVGIFGRMVALPVMLQIAIGVTVCALATFGRPTIRVCLWTCPVILLTAPSLGTPELVGILRVSQVLLGAVIGGMTHLLDHMVWDDWHRLRDLEDTRSAGPPSKGEGIAKARSSRFRSQPE
jgi:uncharacterized membrane protein YccC